VSIHKIGNLWYAAVYIGMKNGKQIYDWSEGFNKKSDAQLKELEMKKEVIERAHKVLDKASLGYIAELWLNLKKKTVAGRTYHDYKENYERYIKGRFEKRPVKDIEPIDISEFMVSLDFKPATVAKIMTPLKQILDYAITLHYIKENPCTGIKKPNIRRQKKKTWTPKQIKTFLELSNAKEATCYTAFMILFGTSMRPGEVCGLQWSDFDGHGFWPKRGIDKYGNITELKNDKAKEYVYLSAELIMHLNKLKIIQMNIWKQQRPFEPFPEDAYINCFTDDWRPMTPDYLYKAFKRILERNKIAPIRLYDARHSFGTNMIRAGVNPKLVAEMMRHTDVRTTLENYVHPDEKMYKNAVSMYNKKFMREVH
jgi:integrase